MVKIPIKKGIVKEVIFKLHGIFIQTILFYIALSAMFETLKMRA